MQISDQHMTAQKDNEWKYKSISILNQKNLNLPKDILAFTKQI